MNSITIPTIPKYVSDKRFSWLAVQLTKNPNSYNLTVVYYGNRESEEHLNEA